MRLGFVTFEKMAIPESITKAAEYGFDAIELQMAYAAAGTTQSGRDYLDDHADTITTRLADANLDLVIHLPHTMDIGATADRIREAAVDETKACLDTAARLGAEACVIHPTSSARTRVWPPDHIRNQILTSIRTLDTYAREHDIRLCMENLWRGVFPIHAFDVFFNETDCRMTLDTGHARITGMTAPEMAEFTTTHKHRIGHVHANDNKAYVVGPDEPPADDHVPTGAGDFDFGTALAPLQHGWDGTVSLELHTTSLEYVNLAKRHFDQQLAQ